MPPENIRFDLTLEENYCYIAKLFIWDNMSVLQFSNISLINILN